MIAFLEASGGMYSEIPLQMPFFLPFFTNSCPIDVVLAKCAVFNANVYPHYVGHYCNCYTVHC